MVRRKRIPRGLVLADTGEEIVVEIFENERFVPTYGWSSPTSFISSDRANFSNETGDFGISDVQTLEELDKPDIGGVLEWIDAKWSLDRSFDVGCDEAGWSYALEWYFLSRGHIEEQDLSNSSRCFVRRRRWLRRLRRLTRSELQAREVRLAISDGAEVTLLLKHGEIGENDTLGVSLRYHDREKSVYLHRWQGQRGTLRSAIEDFKHQHPSAIFHPALSDLVVAVNDVILIGSSFKDCVELIREQGENGGVKTITLRRVTENYGLEKNSPVSMSANVEQRKEGVLLGDDGVTADHKSKSIVSEWMARRTGSGTKSVYSPRLAVTSEGDDLEGFNDLTSEHDKMSTTTDTDVGVNADTTNVRANDSAEEMISSFQEIDDEDEVYSQNSEEYFEGVPVSETQVSVTSLPSVFMSVPSVEFSSISNLMLTALSPRINNKEGDNINLDRHEFEATSSSDEESLDDIRTSSEPPRQVGSTADSDSFFGMFHISEPWDNGVRRPETPPLPVEELKAAMLLNHAPLVRRPKNSTRRVRFAEELEQVLYFEKVEESHHQYDREDIRPNAPKESDENDTERKEIGTGPVLIAVTGRASAFV